MSEVPTSAVQVANRSAGRRPKFSLRTLFVFLTVLCIWFGYPFLKANWLLHKLNTANTVPEAIALVDQILADNTQYSRYLLAQYSAQSSLRAFDSRHSVFLIHDQSDGKTHYTVGTFSKGAFSYGVPPIKYAGIFLVSHASNAEPARFILRELGSNAYIEKRFNFQGTQLISSGTHPVSRASVDEWSTDIRWPTEWK
jgi:hypothetical protein